MSAALAKQLNGNITPVASISSILRTRIVITWAAAMSNVEFRGVAAWKFVRSRVLIARQHRELFASVTHAQSPAFDVVSVKPPPPGTQGGGVQFSPSGRVTWTNVTLQAMVNAAYRRFNWDSREIVGGPNWFNQARFDVIAVAPGGLPLVDADGFPSQLLAMFRGVLEDRFKLVARWDTREGRSTTSCWIAPTVASDRNWSRLPWIAKRRAPRSWRALHRFGKLRWREPGFDRRVMRDARAEGAPAGAH